MDQAEEKQGWSCVDYHLEGEQMVEDEGQDCLIDQNGSSVIVSDTKFTEFTVKFKRPFVTTIGKED